MKESPKAAHGYMEITLEECADGTWTVKVGGEGLVFPHLSAATEMADTWMTAWKRDLPMRVRHKDGLERLAKVEVTRATEIATEGEPEVEDSRDLQR